MSIKPILATLAVAVVTAALILPRVFSERQATSQPRSPAAAAARAPIEVDLFTVTESPLRETFTTVGSLLADEEVTVTAEIAGRVVELTFDEGTPVRRGDLLFRLNDAELRAQLERTRVRRELALTQEQRLERLYADRGISQDQLDQAVNERRVLDAEIDLIQAQLDKSSYFAPFDGVIGLRHVSLGAVVAPGTRVATLLRLNPIKLDFSLPERYRERVRPGIQVGFRLTGINRIFEGEVYAVEPRVDIATRSLSLRARAANPDGTLLPGGFASVEVLLDEIPNAIMIPTSAIVPGLNQRSVFVMIDGKAVPRLVETGQRFPHEIQILSGLKVGETVITSGLLALRPGLPVTQRIPAPTAD